MKKIISLISAIAMFAAISGAAIAADNNPEVYVNNAKINFADQEAVIVDSRTLVPARGVFEAMGADVDWDGDARVVSVESGDHKTIVKLTIDDNTMKVYDVVGMFAAAFGGEVPETAVELDVAPQIISDRTMIPLRAISEAVGAKVDWKQEEYRVDIITKDAPTEEQAEKMPTYSLSVSADQVDEGETVDVYLNVKNLPADTYVSGITAVIKFDTESFEFVNSEMVNGDVKVEDAFGLDNDQYGAGEVKINYTTIVKDTAPRSDGQIAKLTFKSLNGKEGAFTLVNGYWDIIRYDASLLIATTDDNETETFFNGTKLNIDFTPVIVNGEAAPEATAEPEATEAPAETAE